MRSFVVVLHYFCNQKNNIATYFKNCFLFKYGSFVIRIQPAYLLPRWVLISKIKFALTGLFPTNFFLD